MFKIFVPGGEFYDESINEFIEVKPQSLQLEHSLLSISRWESKWNRSFLDNGPKTEEEKLSYIQDMTITKDVNPFVYKILSDKQRKQIEAYCKLPMTATTITRRNPTKSKKQIITSELIYYWMISFGIPFECEKWHINRLLMLIEVCSIKNNSKKETPQEAAARTKALNAQRRARKR